MTENEALEELKTFPINCLDFKENQALQVAIKALSEIQKYRAIGTIEEFKDLKEKNVAKKAVDLQINKMQSFCEDDFGREIPCTSL